jgi:aerobic-type carbon monoxide dehydrogenase small subunit (CoxS/CutS family)
VSELIMDITLTVNGEPVSSASTPRTTLVDFLRDDLALDRQHVGCEHGVCGAPAPCGSTARSCAAA